MAVEKAISFEKNIMDCANSKYGKAAGYAVNDNGTHFVMKTNGKNDGLLLYLRAGEEKKAGKYLMLVMQMIVHVQEVSCMLLKAGEVKMTERYFV